MLKTRCTKKGYSTAFDAMIALHDIRRKKERRKKHDHTKRHEKRTHYCRHCKKFHLTSEEKNDVNAD
jgi:hypothetical protein